MSGSLKQAWDYFCADVWGGLAAHANVPPDLFSDLYMEADGFLTIPTTEAALAAIRNDPDQARAYFLSLKGADFSSEMALLNFLEKARDVLAEYDIPGYVELYKHLIREQLQKYNLRYRLDDPFDIRILLPGSFTNLYGELRRVNLADPHLSRLLADFEYAFDRYARTQHPTDLTTCIAKATNYAEGLASAAAGHPEKGNTLGALAKRAGDWPHDKVREALVNVYHFCCDYPGIRHGGTPGKAVRDLATRDLTLASLLLLSFSGYLVPAVDERAVLGI